MSGENRGWIALTLAVLGLLTALVQSDPFKTWFQWFMQSKHPSELTSPTPAHSYKSRFIPVSRASDNNGNLGIREVDLTPRATILQMSWHSSGGPNEPAGFRVHSPTSPDALQLFDADYSHSYRLLDVIGVATDKWIYDHSHDDFKPMQYNFTLKFEPLPEDTNRFNLVEGDGKPSSDEPKPWTFTNIPLLRD
jgi:hypothetical protein